MLHVFREKVHSFANGLLGLNQAPAKPAVFDLFYYTQAPYAGPEKDLNAFLDHVSLKYDLKGVLVLKDRKMVAHSKWPNHSELVKACSLFASFDGHQSPGFNSHCMYLHSGDWYSFYRWNDYLFVVRAGDCVAVPELEAMSKELVFFIKTGKPLIQRD